VEQHTINGYDILGGPERVSDTQGSDSGKVDMMDVQRFEQEILRLAFETNARLTPASVAYYLGVPSREANQLLNTLLEEGVLELDSDRDGNLYYRVPHQDIIAHELQAFEALHEESIEEDIQEPAEQSPLMSVALVSATDDPGVQTEEALSPSRHRPPEQHALRATDGGAQSAPSPEPIPSAPAAPIVPTTYASPVSYDGPKEVASFAELEGVVRRTQESSSVQQGRGRNVLVGVTRSMEHDAWVGNCGASAVVVTQDARCEPKPLSESRPILVSCEPESIQSKPEPSAPKTQQAMTHGEWWDRPSPEQHSGAMVLADNSQLPARLEDVEQPEHQPGIALLLSLILCGTGQIYNGEVSKGIMMMVLCFLLWFVLLGWVVHIWSIVDAVVVAERINRRKLAEVF